MPDLPTGTLTFLFSDVEGSTRLWETQHAEMRTALARHDALLRQSFAAHRGHVFKTSGDAFCAVFPSAPDAIAAALGAQRSLRAEPWPPPLRLKVRMALHTGTAELRDADYFGEPLNRVARLLSAGHGEQTLVSETTNDLCRDHLPPQATLKSLGEHHLKDLARREPVFQLVHPELPQAFPPLKTLLRPADADTPSIAVLPFVNLSHDDENEYFADGLADELLNMLSKVRGLRVASRTSSFYFKGKDADLATVAQKLNVATVLEGSMRKSGNRVRITAQLIQVATDSHLWSETYDRELTDIFAVQDDIAKSVVTELRTALLGESPSRSAAAQVAAEVATLGRDRGENAEAYRLYLQGKFLSGRNRTDDLARGGALCARRSPSSPTMRSPGSALRGRTASTPNTAARPLSRATPARARPCNARSSSRPTWSKRTSSWRRSAPPTGIGPARTPRSRVRSSSRRTTRTRSRRPGIWRASAAAMRAPSLSPNAQWRWIRWTPATTCCWG